MPIPARPPFRSCTRKKGGKAAAIEADLYKDEKRAWRREKAAWRDSRPAAWREAASAAAWERFFSLPEVAAAGTIMLYASFRSELSTVAAMRQVLAGGRRLVLPRIQRAARSLEPCPVRAEADLTPGAYGIPEPAPAIAPMPAAAIDVVAVPGVVFDRIGQRIGYGAGYYDRFLPRLREEALTVGMAFAGQLAPRLPRTPLDFRLPCLVTEEEVVRQPRCSNPDRRYSCFAVAVSAAAGSAAQGSGKALRLAPMLAALQRRAPVFFFADRTDLAAKLAARRILPQDCLTIAGPAGNGVAAGLAIGTETLLLAAAPPVCCARSSCPHFVLADWREWLGDR